MIKKYLVLLTVIMLWSCQEGIVDRDESMFFIYKNQTNHNISINKWFGGENNKFDLNPSSQIKFQLKIFSSTCLINDVESNLDCSLVQSDSIVVTFDDVKKVVFNKSDESGMSLYSMENYTKEIINHNTYYNYFFDGRIYEIAQ